MLNMMLVTGSQSLPAPLTISNDDHSLTIVISPGQTLLTSIALNGMELQQAVSMGYVTTSIFQTYPPYNPTYLQGLSGFSGFSSFSGISGFSGTSGTSGLSGTSGFSGQFGDSGTSGFSGQSGYSGYSGYSGASGYSGYFGLSGQSGYSGISGVSGWSSLSGTSGTSGFSGQEGGNAGKIYYLDPSADSDLYPPYFVASPTPSSSPSTSLVQATNNSGSGDTLLAQFATPLNEPGVTALPPGTAYRNFFVNTDGDTSVGRLRLDLSICHFDGSGLHLVRSGYSQPFSGNTVQEIEWTFSDGNSYPMSTTDRIIFSVYTAWVSGGTGGNVPVTVWFDDTVTASFVQTTISAGAVGPSGFSGYSGASGTSGYSGLSGASGTSGYSGLSGASGTSGYSGLSGMLGYSGNSGQSGFSGFSGTTFTSPATLAIVTNATTPVLNPGSIVNNFRLAMPSGATTITLNAPTSGMIDGQIMIVEIDQNSTGAGLVTLSGFVFGSAFASYTLTATANAVDLLGFYYNGNLNQWFVVSLAQGF